MSSMDSYNKKYPIHYESARATVQTTTYLRDDDVHLFHWKLNILQLPLDQDDLCPLDRLQHAD